MRKIKIIQSDFDADSKWIDDHLKLFSEQLSGWINKGWEYKDSFVEKERLFVILIKEEDARHTEP